ncbi:hypothetical protein Sjap_022038 [Stephania japonica]|uniref:Uncharacterized protein n=1 Tax=Stephania japonica TaxID=461633 RepID=A0AAP0HU17_9MAGN
MVLMLLWGLKARNQFCTTRILGINCPVRRPAAPTRWQFLRDNEDCLARWAFFPAWSRFVDFAETMLNPPMLVLPIHSMGVILVGENMEQHFKDINSNLRNIETLASKIIDTLDRLLEEEEFFVLLSCDKKETLNDVTLISVEANEPAMKEHFAIDGLTPCMYEYWSDHKELEGKLEVSQSEPEIVMAQTHEEEAKKGIEVTLTRLEILQQESKEDQSIVLVNLPASHIYLKILTWRCKTLSVEDFLHR